MNQSCSVSKDTIDLTVTRWMPLHPWFYKQIHSKVPILLYFVGAKHPSGNCYINCFLTDRTALLRGQILELPLEQLGEHVNSKAELHKNIFLYHSISLLFIQYLVSITFDLGASGDASGAAGPRLKCCIIKVDYIPPN